MQIHAHLQPANCFVSEYCFCVCIHPLLCQDLRKTGEINVILTILIQIPFNGQEELLYAQNVNSLP